MSPGEQANHSWTRLHFSCTFCSTGSSGQCWPEPAEGWELCPLVSRALWILTFSPCILPKSHHTNTEKEAGSIKALEGPDELPGMVWDVDRERWMETGNADM